MFPTGSLAIVFSAYDCDFPFFFCLAVEVWRNLIIDEFAYGLNIGPERKNFVSCRHDGIGGDVIIHLENYFCRECVR